MCNFDKCVAKYGPRVCQSTRDPQFLHIARRLAGLPVMLESKLKQRKILQAPLNRKVDVYWGVRDNEDAFLPSQEAAA